MKRITSRGILIKNNEILLMYRKKMVNNQLHEYYAIPGGGVEEGESLEQTVVRELKEEMTIDVKVLKYLGIYENETSIQHFFHIDKILGEVTLGGEELERSNPNNFYEPMYVNLESIEPGMLDHLDMIQKVLEKV